MSAMEHPLMSAVFARASDSLYDFLTLKDVLTLSLCSRLTAQFGIDAETIQKYATDEASVVTKIGHFNLRFSEDLTLGMLRRVMNRLNAAAAGAEAVVSVDAQSGRIVLDIGSAFNDRDAFLADAVQLSAAEEEELEGQQEIFKHLEICSMDEYDDFNPRHPKPKDKAHRRGDSYFNSDIEMVVNEMQGESMAVNPAHTMDIKNIAAMALASEESGDGSHAIKNKFLAMKKKTGAMGSPSKTVVKKKTAPLMRAQEELRGGSDDER